jgi:hypothetical protein
LSLTRVLAPIVMQARKHYVYHYWLRFILLVYWRGFRLILFISGLWVLIINSIETIHSNLYKTVSINQPGFEIQTQSLSSTLFRRSTSGTGAAIQMMALLPLNSRADEWSEKGREHASQGTRGHPPLH